MLDTKKSDPRAASPVDRLIGARIRARRLELGVSQSALADVIGVTFQQVQKYERGFNRVSASTLIAIADALDVKASALLPQRLTGGDALPAQSAEAHELIQLFARLNVEGRRLLMGVARSLAADPMLGLRHEG